MYKGKCKKSGEIVAMKKIRLESEQEGVSSFWNILKRSKLFRKKIVLLSHRIKIKSEGAFNRDQGDLHSARASTSKYCQPEGDRDAGCREEEKITVFWKLTIQEAKLYLIFEFLTMDLKKYMEGAVSR